MQQRKRRGLSAGTKKNAAFLFIGCIKRCFTPAPTTMHQKTTTDHPKKKKGWNLRHSEAQMQPVFQLPIRQVGWA